MLRNIYIVNKQLIKLNYVVVHEHGTGPGRLWLDHKVQISLCRNNTEVVQELLKSSD